MALVFFVILVLIGYYAGAFGTHPKFRPWLMEEAKKRLLISEDHAFIPWVNGYIQQLLRHSGQLGVGSTFSLSPRRSKMSP